MSLDYIFWGLVECIDNTELFKMLLELNQLDFVVKGGVLGYSADDIFSLILEKKKLNVKFKETWFRGLSDWFSIER